MEPNLVDLLAEAASYLDWIMLYSPFAERKSCTVSVAVHIDREEETYWDATVGTNACPSEYHHLLRPSEKPSNVFQLAGSLRSN